MYINQIFVFALACVMAGCMSLEERLASNDPTIKRNAEYELVANSRRTGSEADRIAAIQRVTSIELLMEIALAAHAEDRTSLSTIPDGMAAVTKLSDQKILFEVANKAAAEEIRVAAIGRLTDQSYLLKLYKDSYGTIIRQQILPRLNGTSLATISYTTNMIPYWKQISDQRVLAKIYRDGYQALDESDRQAILDKLTDEKILVGMVTPPSESEVHKSRIRLMEEKNKLGKEIREAEYFMKSCIEVAERYEESWHFSLAKKKRAEAEEFKLKIQRLRAELVILIRTCAEDEFLYVEGWNHGLPVAFNVSNHVALVTKLSSESIVKLLDCKTRDGTFLVNDVANRLMLMKRLPEDKMVETVLNDIKQHDVDKWNHGNVVALETGMGVAASVKDRTSAVKIVVMVLTHIVQYHKKCTEPFSLMSWNKSDKMQVEKILAGLPLSESEIGTVICIIPSAWRYLIDRVTPECAYNILMKGKVNPEELEVALIKKLPQTKIDMNVFAGIKSDAGKKVAMAAMPEEVKKIAREKEEKAFAVVMEKAKVAAKDTFELHGFYLGMDWDDMKVVLAHHFPDCEIKVERDGKSKDDDYIIRLPMQRSPFCYASAKDKKIYRFNFGKGILNKWFKYNAASISSWARTYAREHGIEMDLEFLNEDDEIFLPMLGLLGGDNTDTTYSVSLHQETYQYKDATKQYRLTYFGVPKFDCFGGGAVGKAMARDFYNKISAEAGTLRVDIEKD